jgi:glutaredoxin
MDLGSTVKGFLSSRFNIGLLVVLLVLGVAILAVPTEPQDVDVGEGTVLHYFFLPGCPHCAEQEPIVRELETENPDVKFLYHDGSTQAGIQKYIELASNAGLDTAWIQTPTIFLRDKALVGVHSKEQIQDAIEECKKQCELEESQKQSPKEKEETAANFTEFELPFLGKTDLTAFSLPALAAVLGLIDGFNPCAMWVLVYLIALLIEVEDKKKMWLIVGSFILASGILYFLFMTAWLNAFLFLGYVKALTVGVGLAALGGGILSVKDYITSRGEKLECKVETEKGHKKTMKRIQEIVAQPLSIPIILAIIALAFVVNSVEFVCSSAIPAIFTQILALSNISTLERYLYILLYDVFFMLDDLIIFSMAAFAVSSSFGEKYARYCKIIGGVLLVGLGLMLLFAPNLMM